MPGMQRVRPLFVNHARLTVHSRFVGYLYLNITRVHVAKSTVIVKNVEARPTDQYVHKFGTNDLRQVFSYVDLDSSLNFLWFEKCY